MITSTPAGHLLSNAPVEYQGPLFWQNPPFPGHGLEWPPLCRLLAANGCFQAWAAPYQNPLKVLPQASEQEVDFFLKESAKFSL